MHSTQIVEVKSKADVLKFVQFPMDLYKSNPYYVPSLVKDEITVWHAVKNPVYKNAEAKQFLAFKNLIKL